MTRLAFALSAALFLSAAGLAAADDSPVWQDDTAPETVAACKKATALSLPAADSAGPAQKGCDTEAVYYGIGTAPDYAAARACALHAPKDADDMESTVFNGAGMLAMLYANGRGVPRNDDLALAYACQAGGAPAEIDGRVKHLTERKAKGPASSDVFDLCDDITSGYMQGVCQARDSKLADVKRKATLATLTGALQGPARAAYDKLDTVQAAYASAVSENEVDMSGTARAAMALAAEDGAKDAFLDTLQKLLGRKLDSGSPTAFAAADKALNVAYGKAVKTTPGDLGTVTAAGIKTTERAWIAYRDAFLAFARITAPKSSADALATALTERRTADLKGLTGD